MFLKILPQTPLEENQFLGLNLEESIIVPKISASWNDR